MVCQFLLYSKVSQLQGETEVLVTQSCPTLQPTGLQPDRLLCPWNSPGKNTEVSCHSLFPLSFFSSSLFHFPFSFLPNIGIEPRSLSGKTDSLPSEPPGKVSQLYIQIYPLSFLDSNKNPLNSTGNSIQYSVMIYMEIQNLKKEPYVFKEKFIFKIKIKFSNRNDFQVIFQKTLINYQISII